MKIEDKLVASVISGLKALYGQESLKRWCKCKKQRKNFEDI